MSVRVRIAPSPTGLLHVGNARSALFNWFFARHNNGVFVLRIDDTDTERSDPTYTEDVMEGLSWLGLDWDEGIGVGGPHGSYRQSDRFEHYRDLAHRLVEAGHAYFDDRSPGELDQLRSRAQSEGRHPGHYIRRPSTETDRGVIRLSVPADAAIEFTDEVRGEMRFEPDSVDDFVILRSDGSPTYHLASTVDDIDYEITHVIRGEDILSSTPKHILLAQSLDAEPPVYGHLPLLFGPDGKKLSKRHGDTSMQAYREGGYLPEAMANFLALLGWSMEGDRTIFSIDEAVAAFELSKVSRNPAVFDPAKLLWMNGEYIRALDTGAFAERARPYVESGLGAQLSDVDLSRFNQIAPLVQERTKTLEEVADQVKFLFSDGVQFDEDSWQKVMSGEEVPRVLTEARARLESLEPFNEESVEVALRGMLESLELSARKGLQPLRVAMTGSSVSPPLFESIVVLGRELAVQRLDGALDKLGS